MISLRTMKDLNLLPQSNLLLTALCREYHRRTETLTAFESKEFGGEEDIQALIGTMLTYHELVEAVNELNRLHFIDAYIEQSIKRVSLKNKGIDYAAQILNVLPQQLLI